MLAWTHQSEQFLAEFFSTQRRRGAKKSRRIAGLLTTEIHGFSLSSDGRLMGYQCSNLSCFFAALRLCVEKNSAKNGSDWCVQASTPGRTTHKHGTQIGTPCSPITGRESCGQRPNSIQSFAMASNSASERCRPEPDRHSDSVADPLRCCADARPEEPERRSPGQRSEPHTTERHSLTASRSHRNDQHTLERHSHTSKSHKPTRPTDRMF